MLGLRDLQHPKIFSILYVAIKVLTTYFFTCLSLAGKVNLTPDYTLVFCASPAFLFFCCSLSICLSERVFGIVSIGGLFPEDHFLVNTDTVVSSEYTIPIRSFLELLWDNLYDHQAFSLRPAGKFHLLQ